MLPAGLDTPLRHISADQIRRDHKMLPQMLSATEVAKVLSTGTLFVRRRMAPTHNDHIPSVQVGKKRLVRIEDLQTWIDKHRSVQTT